MVTVIIIILTLLALWYFFFKKGSQNIVVSAPPDLNEEIFSDAEILKGDYEIHTDNEGRQYILQETTIQIPRKTYIKGNISGKYRGDLIPDEVPAHNTKNYDFEIYEAEITCSETRQDQPFLNTGTSFPKEKLPEKLRLTLLNNNKAYELNVLEPQLFSFYSIRHLHQTDGREVFGSFNGEVTGYLLDYVPKTIQEIVYLEEAPTYIAEPEEEILQISDVETGEVERRGNYSRRKYFATNNVDTIWGPWRLDKVQSSTSSGGCFSSLLGILGLLLAVAFLLAMLPSLGYAIPLIILLVILYYLGPILKWILRLGAAILAILFLFSLGNAIFNRTNTAPIPRQTSDVPKEKEEQFIPIVETTVTNTEREQNQVVADTLIKRFRSWKDYDGNQYEGTYSLRMNDYRNSSHFKNSLNFYQNSTDSYDRIVHSLKENDKMKLAGLYSMFDSINTAKKLSKVGFAGMVVSFVQDIPYSLILQDECDANLYNDAFISRYLSSPNARCQGYQKFGINAPLEFLAHQQGDCDTRTLLLYTIFAYYGYDVAMLSSEYYGHSILGINLPVSGTAYQYGSQRYVLWETTAPELGPGFINNDISNLNNWRISLKSK